MSSVYGFDKSSPKVGLYETLSSLIFKIIMHHFIKFYNHFRNVIKKDIYRNKINNF